MQRAQGSCQSSLCPLLLSIFSGISSARREPPAPSPYLAHLATMLLLASAPLRAPLLRASPLSLSGRQQPAQPSGSRRAAMAAAAAAARRPLRCRAASEKEPASGTQQTEGTPTVPDTPPAPAQQPTASSSSSSRSPVSLEGAAVWMGRLCDLVLPSVRPPCCAHHPGRASPPPRRCRPSRQCRSRRSSERRRRCGSRRQQPAARSRLSRCVCGGCAGADAVEPWGSDVARSRVRGLVLGLAECSCFISCCVHQARTLGNFVCCRAGTAAWHACSGQPFAAVPPLRASPHPALACPLSCRASARRCG